MEGAPTREEWFRNFGRLAARRDRRVLRAGIDAGLLDAQDEWGLTALSLAVLGGWTAGVLALLRAGADPERRHHRTGETTLRMAVAERSEELVRLLLDAGAKPDAPAHNGTTPRQHAEALGMGALFAQVPVEVLPRPAPHVQDAEHLADHYHPRFRIPPRSERESLGPGRAVDLVVFGPPVEGRTDRVKVRITAREGQGAGVRYTADVETPLAETHLLPGTTSVTFGPEHVATVWVPRAAGA